jgi:hypothetical protein
VAGARKGVFTAYVLGQEKPTLAVGLVPQGAGNIHLGDEVVLED